MIALAIYVRYLCCVICFGSLHKFSLIQLSITCGVVFTCSWIFTSLCWCLVAADAVLSTWLSSCDSWVTLVGYLYFEGCWLLCSTVSLCLLSSPESSCVIIGAQGVITLGVVTVSGTLCGGTVSSTCVGAIVGTSIGNTVVWFFSGCMVLKFCSNLLMACNWLSLIAKGAYGPGFLITCISYLEALVTYSAADNPGMMRCCGKTSTTSACLYPLMLGV